MSAFFTCLNVFALDSLSTQVLDSSKKFDKWQFTGPLPYYFISHSILLNDLVTDIYMYMN